jgi:hypothetical protein
MRLFDDAGKHHVREQSGILGELAEHNAIQEMGHGPGIKAPLAHGFGNVTKTLGGLLGDGGTRAAWAEGFGIMEDRSHDFDVAGFGKGLQ